MCQDTDGLMWCLFEKVRTHFAETFGLTDRPRFWHFGAAAIQL
jgi:hypothetical protein